MSYSKVYVPKAVAGFWQVLKKKKKKTEYLNDKTYKMGIVLSTAQDGLEIQ